LRGCIDLEFDEDSRIGFWIEINKKSYLGLLKWALTLSDTPQDDLGWGMSSLSGTEAKAQLHSSGGGISEFASQKECFRAA
jgi:hypothetical protein